MEWVCDPDAFAALADRWDALLPEDSHPSDLHCWYLCWWEAFGASSELEVCTVWRGEQLAGAFPLRREGPRLFALVNGHSPMSRPLAVDSEAMAALTEAVAEAGAEGRGLELRELPAEDAGVETLASATRGAGLLAVRERACACPFVDTRGSYDAWRRENKGRWKAPLERRWRKMERENGAVLDPIATPGDLEPELEEGLRLEASGWKGEEGTAIDANADTAAFYRSMTRALHQRGEVRFGWIRFGGVAVAFDLCLLYRNRLYLLKTGYDERHRALSPGSVLRLAAIKGCFEAGIDAHDLLGDEIGWKTKFASGTRPNINLRGYPRWPAGFLRYGYRARVRPRLKTAYRRLRPATR